MELYRRTSVLMHSIPTLMIGESFTEVRGTFLLGSLFMINVGCTMSTAVGLVVVISGKSVEFLLLACCYVSKM